MSWNRVFDNENIKTATDDYFQQNQMPCFLSDNEGFNTLHKDQVLEIVKMRVLNCSEELLLERVLEWKKTNEDQTIDDLIPHIRLEVDEEYQIVDFFSKEPRWSRFERTFRYEEKYAISECLVFTTPYFMIKYTIGFSIFLSNILEIKDYVEEFNIKVYFKPSGLVFYDRDFITKVENEFVVGELIFKFPLRFYDESPNSYADKIYWRVTFKKAANRYHCRNEVIFPFYAFEVPLYEEIHDADRAKFGYKILKEN